MAEKHKGDAPRGREAWWVRHQHHEVSVHSGERPDTKTEPGERLAVAFGPFRSREDAQKRADKIKERTTAHRAGR